MKDRVQMKAPKRVEKPKRKQMATKYVVEILGEDENCYCAEIRNIARRLRFTKVKKKTSEKSRATIKDKGQALELSCLFADNRGLSARNVNNLVGAKVVLRERRKRKSKVAYGQPVQSEIIRGKIISVHPYIIGTQPGTGGLPPVDE